MVNQILSTLLLFTLTQSTHAEPASQATFTDDFGTTLLVNLLIIAVYALYWIRQKA